ncbi:MAG: hypothetical protein KatS3mg003_0301 [Candidatus Nitrosocaldaceae archaeon]|nr:MAG: hypothetical protein KatS3mg003_0301 [Candidatus Nitrosocaldaceae archaeon]
MKIALDLDGTLADIIGSWLIEYNKKSREKLDYNNITKWDFWIKLGYTPTRFFKELSNCWKRWQHIKPIEDRVSYAVEQLHRFGKVDIVTARDPESSNYAKEWLNYYNIPYNEFVLVARGSDKAYLDYDIFIDDSPINAKKISRFNKMILLYDQPWNRDVRENNNIIRIRKLLDALDLIPRVIA